MPTKRIVLMFVIGYACMFILGWGVGYHRGMRDAAAKVEPMTVKPAVTWIICTFDNAGQIGDYVGPSQTVAGECHAMKSLEASGIGKPYIGILGQAVEPNSAAQVSLWAFDEVGKWQDQTGGK